MNLVIAAGGTGGHIMPGLGLAEAAVQAGLARNILFIGARNGLEGMLVPAAGFRIETLPVGRFRGMGLKTRLSGLAGLGLSVPMAHRLLKEFGASAVVGMGGYASAPALIAGAMAGIPTALCEQNTIPGSTNRILARFAQKVCVSFSMSSGYLPPHKVVVTGNPVRRALLEARKRRLERVRSDSFTILVLGGSQGALFLNKTVARSLASFAKGRPTTTIIHQTGAGRRGEAADAYRKLGERVEVVEYIEDIGSLLERVDLVVGRAGATTVAELSVVGVPSILVPFPFATDNHQFWNAKVMVQAGAALLFEQHSYNEDRFLDELERLSRDPKALATMGSQARKLGRVDAAEAVLEQLGRMS
jgi:UDP-N-acetylglucosamine--N-acetylmuramyl-(pentapeptide) pyrophosphoryl-undecaprenol N-acetylglucosamine transferase